jgi:hypothetical protein
MSEETDIGRLQMISQTIKVAGHGLMDSSAETFAPPPGLLPLSTAGISGDAGCNGAPLNGLCDLLEQQSRSRE